MLCGEVWVRCPWRWRRRRKRWRVGPRGRRTQQMGDSRVFSWDRGVALVEVRATVNDAQSAAILSVSLVGK